MPLISRSCCLLLLILAGPAAAGPLASPESALRVGGSLYVSNLGAEPAPTKVDGDGFIARLSPQGEVLEPRFLPRQGALNAPKGMAALGGRLCVTDIDRVVGFDLDGREQVFELSLREAGAGSLNDLAVRDERLLVSDTQLGRIFEIDPAKGSYRVLVKHAPGANGLVYDAPTQRLYVAGYGESGRLGYVDLASRWPRYRPLGLRGRLDGIGMLREWVIVSDWNGKAGGQLHAYHPRRGNVVRDLLPAPVGGPADFELDPQSGRIWLPAMKEDRLVIGRLGVGGRGRR